MEDVSRVCAIGDGYIGLEAAAALVKLGKHVTVPEAKPREVARVAGFYDGKYGDRAQDTL